MLWRMKDGEWACRLEVFVIGEGISFEVKHVRGATPKDALQGCKANLDAAFAQFATSTKTLNG
jgi:hypothetical protein